MRLDKGRLLRNLILTVLLMFSCAPFAFAQQANVVVVANISVESHSLSPSQLRSIFSMRQNTWPDGQPIKVYVFTRDSTAHDAFCKQILKMFPYQVERIWNKLTYSGLGELPIRVETESEMLSRIESEPGAIGYTLASGESQGMHQIKVISE